MPVYTSGKAGGINWNPPKGGGGFWSNLFGGGGGNLFGVGNNGVTAPDRFKRTLLMAHLMGGVGGAISSPGSFANRFNKTTLNPMISGSASNMQRMGLAGSVLGGKPAVSRKVGAGSVLSDTPKTGLTGGDFDFNRWGKGGAAGYMGRKVFNGNGRNKTGF